MYEVVCASIYFICKASSHVLFFLIADCPTWREVCWLYVKVVDFKSLFAKIVPNWRFANPDYFATFALRLFIKKF